MYKKSLDSLSDGTTLCYVICNIGGWEISGNGKNEKCPSSDGQNIFCC
ncbi:MAG: hypothetical protein IJ011_10560 [Clostridia bacterium]|nr:hypothetical protein [Clostridia bacterium]MBQ8850763.1 hypothetical protein [Clostridia bacterium]